MWSNGSWIYNSLCNQCLSITINVVRSNASHGEVYSLQHYVIKFVSDLRQVGGFLLVFRFPPPIKLTSTLSWTGFSYLNSLLLSRFSSIIKSDSHDITRPNSKETTWESDQLIRKGRCMIMLIKSSLKIEVLFQFLQEGNLYIRSVFVRPSRDGPYYVIGYGGRWRRAAGVHTGVHTITLVRYIGSLPYLAT